jgi:pyrroloquinoline quinone biosynthesis protein B
VLGSAAGGGFPQWNCNCPNCAGLRAGTLKAQPRTQSSIAVAGGGSAWVLVDASPDISQQIHVMPGLQPNRGIRDTALQAIVLTDDQVDHTTGLYMLRENARPWPLWCSDSTYVDLTVENPVLRVLGYFCGVERHRITLEEEFVIEQVPDLIWRALAVASKPAPYSPHRDAPVRGDNLALVIRDEASRQRLVYAPGLVAIDEVLWQAMETADCVMVDGTFWSDEEMQALGVSKKKAREIGHLPQSGPGGMLEYLDRLPAGVRKVLTHINNTNPILNETSPQAGELRQRGIEVAYDGMEIIV